MNVLIYGRGGCVHCDDAKAISELNRIIYTWKDVTVGDNRKELLELYPDAKTIPQIFVNGFHVGGFTEYSAYVAKHLVDDKGKLR